MNKKTIIACISALAVLAVIVAVSVFFLYSGTETRKVSSLASDNDTGLFSAVPSDAVAVVEFEDLNTACRMLTDSAGCFHYLSGSASGGKLVSYLKAASEVGLGSLKSSKTVLSLHFNGSVVPLLLIDVCRSGADVTENMQAFLDKASASGLAVHSLDCSQIAEGRSYISGRRLFMLSVSDVFTKSSERHIRKGISILDAEGFAESAGNTESENAIFVSCAQIGKVFTGFMDRRTYGYAEFFKKFADWMVFSVEENDSDKFVMSGRPVFEEGVEDFINVFGRYSPAKTRVASVLPAYTTFFVSFPVSGASSCISSLDEFWDATGRLDKIQSYRRKMQNETGTSPVQWAEALGVKEVALAGFMAGDSMENIMLLKISTGNLPDLFETKDSSLKKSEVVVRDYPYKGYVSAAFGPYFSLTDESSYIISNGWLIVGSRAAMDEYVSGRALENTLGRYIQDSSTGILNDSGDSYLTVYHSVGESPETHSGFFRPAYAASLAGLSNGYSYVPSVFSIKADKKGLFTEFSLCRVEVVKSKAPVHERDTVVVVPSGPFKVKNSGTGETNLFYQQDNNYLCLKTLKGKGLWGVPFSEPICGNAGTIDYFANGKLQILFAAGSSLYLIDRLGRYVKPFPVKLGKEVLLGPGIYDFNGSKQYNVMILHKDNTIEMYNLKGKRPAQWKTIMSKETIKGLPEMIKAGGKTYWVVRTSIQTLIYGFYGGEPLTVFEGDRMIRSDSKIVPSDGASVKAVCYDGKTHIIKLQK